MLARRGLRLIPAHAGKTARALRMSETAMAHPRSRGENVSHQSQVALQVGSSPLTRGKHTHDGECPSLGRLIPAHAGKTSAR